LVQKSASKLPWTPIPTGTHSSENRQNDHASDPFVASSRFWGVYSGQTRWVLLGEDKQQGFENGTIAYKEAVSPSTTILRINR